MNGQLETLQLGPMGDSKTWFHISRYDRPKFTHDQYPFKGSVDGPILGTALRHKMYPASGPKENRQQSETPDLYLSFRQPDGLLLKNEGGLKVGLLDGAVVLLGDAEVRTISESTPRLTAGEKAMLKGYGVSPKQSTPKSITRKSLLPRNERQGSTDTSVFYMNDTEKLRCFISQKGQSFLLPEVPLRCWWRENGGELHHSKETESHFPAIEYAKKIGLTLTKAHDHLDTWVLNQIWWDTTISDEDEMRSVLRAEIADRKVEFFAEEEIGYDEVPTTRKVMYVKTERKG